LDVGRLAAELVSREPHFGQVGCWLTAATPGCDTEMNLSELAMILTRCFGEGYTEMAQGSGKPEGTV
jgi:hypothetical protein